MPFNLLIVDDSLPMRSVIIKTIRASGFSTANFLEASNGREALKILKQEWLDLVITDYNMPDMNGMDLISEMKKDTLLNSIPVLVVTTEGSKKKYEEFMQRGATDYVKKPFTPEMIKIKMNQILGEMKDEADTKNCDEGLDF
ncbi:MAG: response regulator [Desulfobacterales bacterium]|nr:response regulator [Desulfobacterales bacterium]